MSQLDINEFNFKGGRGVLFRRVYVVTLMSGVGKKVTRMEPEDKSAIGLWVWSKKQSGEVFIDFEEGTVLASEVAMIERIIGEEN